MGWDMIVFNSVRPALPDLRFFTSTLRSISPISSFCFFCSGIANSWSYSLHHWLSTSPKRWAEEVGPWATGLENGPLRRERPYERQPAPGTSSQLVPCPGSGQACLNQEVSFNSIKFVSVLTLGFPASGAMRNKFLLLIAIQFIAFCYCRANCEERVFIFLGRICLGYSWVIVSSSLLAPVSTNQV